MESPATVQSTTIRISLDTWRRLQLLKVTPSKTVDGLIAEMLDEREKREGAGQEAAGK